MHTKLIKAGLLSGIVLLFASCTDEGEETGGGVVTGVDEIEYEFNVPSTYVFTRDSETTVSFSGQTTRISMNKEIVGYFSVDSGKTAVEIEAAFDHSSGNADFLGDGLDDSSKNVKGKIAASADLFGDDSFASDAIKAVFSGYITSHVGDVVANMDVLATAGTAGYVTNGDKTRYVNEKGLEYNQAFAKASIGALLVDQILNNYLGNEDVSDVDLIAANNSETLADGKTYTTYEHHFDEAYGYVYGDPSVDAISPIDAASDSFLFKYITKVNSDTDFAGIQDEIFTAFKIGRAAVVAQEYDVLEDAIEVLQYQISKVIGVRAIHYLQAGKTALADADNTSAFHDLSEGYGFVYSLQFTRNPETDAPYFSSTEVDALIAKLDAGNGFWDLADGTVLDEVSNTIADKFDFTMAEAAE